MGSGLRTALTGEQVESKTGRESPRSKASPAAWLGLAVLWGLTLCYLLVLVQTLPRFMRGYDFGIYYVSALSLHLGRNPYTEHFADLAARLGVDLGGIERSVDTPTFLLAFQPLVHLPLTRAYPIWMGLIAASLIAALWLLLGPRSSLPTVVALLLASLALIYPPTGANLRFAQSQIFVLLIIVLMMRLMESGHDAGAGILLSVAVLLRAYPALLIGYLLLKRRWRAFALTMAGILAGGIVTIVAVGPTRTLSFLAAVGVAPRTNFLSLDAIGILPERLAHGQGNGSIQNAVAMLFVLLHATSGSPLVRSMAAWLVEAALLGFTIKATSSDTADEARGWSELCLWVAAMIMLSPIAWAHYQVLLLIPYAQVVSVYIRGGAGKAALFMIIASYCLALMMVFLGVLAGASDPANSVRPEWLAPLVLLQLTVPLSAYIATYCAVRGSKALRGRPLLV